MPTYLWIQKQIKRRSTKNVPQHIRIHSVNQIIVRDNKREFVWLKNVVDDDDDKFTNLFLSFTFFGSSTSPSNMAFLSVQAQKVRHSVSGSGLGKLITGQHKPESPAELYYMYKDEFGYFPKEPHHLVSFGTKKSYKIGHAKAEDVIFDPPDPPKGRLPNGGFIWSDDDESEMEDSEVSEDSNNSFDTESDMSQEDRGDKWGPQHHSSTVHSAWESQRSETNLSSHQEIKPRSQFSKVKRAQLVRVGWVLPATSMSHYVIPYSQTLKKGNREHSLDVEEIDDLILYDSSGYGLYPFTDRLILRFHLNFPAKQWKKASKVFLTGLECCGKVIDCVLIAI